MDASQLRGAANRLDELSFESLTFKLVNGNVSQPLSVNTFSVTSNSLRPFFNQAPIPTYTPPSSSLDQIDIFVDRQHPFFVELGCTVEFAVATQVASFLQALVGSTANGMTTLNLAHRVLQTAFGERVSLTKESVRRSVEDLLESISDGVTAMPWCSALSTELTNAEVETLVEKLQQVGKLATLEQIKGSGQFLRYVPSSLPRLLRLDFARWSGTVFTDESAEYKDVAPLLAQRASEQARQAIMRALEDCTDFLESPTVDETTLRKVKLSVEFVGARLQ
jgi:Leucine-rich repeat (LRR) protein